MGKVFLAIALGLPSIALFVGAAWCAHAGKDGWGWMLFAGVLVCPIANPGAAAKIIASFSGRDDG